jgi:hypothetical protein
MKRRIREKTEEVYQKRKDRRGGEEDQREDRGGT